MAGGETPPKNTFISGAQKVVLQIGDGGDDVITMEAGTDISSAMIEHTADSRPAAQPSGDELLKQVQEIAGNDEENRNAINGAVTQMLVDNKRASKQYCNHYWRCCANHCNGRYCTRCGWSGITCGCAESSVRSG